MTSIELLAWTGCPSHPKAAAALHALLAELGRPDQEVTLRWVESEQDAQRERFLGSPTIRVNGSDIVPDPGTGPYGLTCRIYRTRAGSISPIPDPDDLRDALTSAYR